MNDKRDGFTLIELLIVVGIVSLLAALLFSVFASVRAKGRQTACLSNLHQLSLGVFQYAQDFDDHYPYGGDPSDLKTTTWQSWQDGKYWPAVQQMQTKDQTLPNVMSGYIKDSELWHCPADSGFDLGGSFEDTPLAAHPSCFAVYGMSYVYTTLLALDGQTLSSVRAWSRLPPYSPHDPADIPLLHDHSGHWHGGTVLSDERFNEVMLDGHAVSIGRDRERELDRILFAIPVQPIP